MTTGINLRNIGKQNTCNVLKLLMMEKSLSRKELATKLGLTKMTVGNIVNHLKQEGLIEEEKRESETNSIGPKPTAVKIASRRILAVGVHITPKKITTMLVDVVDGILYKETQSVDNLESNQQVLYVIKDMVATILDKYKDYSTYLVGIGVTYNGVVDTVEGKITFCINQIDKEELNVKSVLTKRFNLPVVVASEVEGAAIAELVFGTKLGDSRIYYMNLSNSIRGGFINGYTINAGTHGMSGEVGHMSIKYDGPLCLCGSRGCYHLFGSVDVLLKKSECHSIEELHLKLQDRDPLSLRTMEDFIQVTTSVCSNIVHLYDPAYILIGGEIAKLDGSIFRKIERLLNERIIFRKERYVKVIRSHVKEKANEIGAAMVVLQELFV